MAVFQARDRIGSETSADLAARFTARPQPGAQAEQMPASSRLTLTWFLDSRTGRPVSSWVSR
jgi:hypothetical protein